MAFSSPGETRKALLSVRVREGGAECCCGSCRSVVLLFSPQVRACGGVLVWKPVMGSLLRVGLVPQWLATQACMGKVLNFEGSGSGMGWKGIMALNYDLPIVKCPMAEKEISNSGSGEDEGRFMPVGRLRCIANSARTGMLMLNGDRTAEAGRKLAPKLEVLISLVEINCKKVCFL